MSHRDERYGALLASLILCFAQSSASTSPQQSSNYKKYHWSTNPDVTQVQHSLTVCTAEPADTSKAGPRNFNGSTLGYVTPW